MEAGEFVWALIEQADSRLLEAELARLLRADLADPLPGARARRRAYLWLLHDLIEQTGERFPQRLLYDRERAGMKAPTSRTIVNQYGTWWEACAIASRMEDGGRLPRGRSYSGGRLRGRFAPEMYTVEEGIASVRLCAFTIGRRPSSGEYDAWQLRQVRIARERNVERRVPSRCALARLFPGKRRWERALAAAAITDAELQAARAAFLHRPHDSDENPFLHLPVREASILAVELKGSLDWLAGRTCERTPVPDAPTSFSAERFLAVRERSPVSPARLAEAAGLTVGQARRLLTSSYEPTLGQLVALASLLGVAAIDVCESA